MFVDEKNVVLEASVQMRLEPQVYHYRVMVAVDMCIHTIEPLENLPQQTGECLRKWDAYITTELAQRPELGSMNNHTNSAWEHLLVINVSLDPGHQMFNVFRR